MYDDAVPIKTATKPLDLLIPAHACTGVNLPSEIWGPAVHCLDHWMDGEKWGADEI